jgi:hypothetical protein
MSDIKKNCNFFFHEKFKPFISLLSENQINTDSVLTPKSLEYTGVDGKDSDQKKRQDLHCGSHPCLKHLSCLKSSWAERRREQLRQRLYFTSIIEIN